jgi:hypothetical protein
MVITPFSAFDLRSATVVDWRSINSLLPFDPDPALLFELSRDHRAFREHFLGPITPIWQGFAINTAFYAGVWWCLIFGPRVARREMRRRRGQCVMCAYSRAGLAEGAVCPECGGSV